MRKIVRLFQETYSVRCHEVVLHFVSQKRICSLHEIYFNDPSPTDCISFPIDPLDDPSSHSVLGEVFVCPEVAIAYAKAHKKKAEEEVVRYVVHGLLHLIGYEDTTPEKRRKMRRAEKELLCQLSTKTRV